MGTAQMVTKTMQTFKYIWASPEFLAPKDWLIKIWLALMMPLTTSTFISEFHTFPIDAAPTYMVLRDVPCPSFPVPFVPWATFS